MKEKIKELLTKYIESKYSVINEFSGDISEGRKALYNEIESYCKDFDIIFSDELFPENMLDMMAIDNNE